MAYLTDTATNYKTALQDLIDFVTGSSVTSATVSAAGTGYNIGDLVTDSSGTGTANTRAQFRVATVSSGPPGPVATVTVAMGGSYSANPTNPVATTADTGPGDNNLTLNLTLATNGWSINRRTKEGLSAVAAITGTGYTVGDDLTVVGGVEVATSAVFNVDTLTTGAVSATIATGGGGSTAYTVGDTVTLVGGTFVTAATFNVDTVGGGGDITAVTVVQNGDYSVFPGNPVTVSGGTGTPAATLTVTSAATSVSQAGLSLVTAGKYGEVPTNPAATTVVPSGGTGATLTVTYQNLAITQDFDVLLEGVGSGSDQIFVGIRSFTVGSAFNWELSGQTGYTVALTFANQPGISPGRNDLSERGAYVPLANSTVTYFMKATGRRFIFVIKAGTTYSNGYMGFLNTFSTPTSYPYPLAIFGCSSLHSRVFTENQIGFSGLCDPIASSSGAAGPAFLRTPGGTFESVQNGFDSGSSRTALNALVVHPCGQININNIATEDRQTQGAFSWQDIIPNAGDPGAQAADMLQTPDTTSLSIPIPCTITQQTPSASIHGELDEVFWVSGRNDSSSKVSEDTITEAGVVFKVFQNCLRTTPFSFLAISEL